MNRYVIGFIVAIGLIVLLIILLFSGGGNKSKVPNTSQTLESYSTSGSVIARLTIDGPINAQQNHDEVQITVGRDDTEYAQLQGYDGSVVKSQTYSNSQNAYNVFLHALDHAGFTKGDTSSALADERGYCPTGDRYIFELINGSNDIERFWATSCGTPKTFNGNLNLNLTLFQQQIPDYGTLTENVNL
jgi:hypothetical protein